MALESGLSTVFSSQLHAELFPWKLRSGRPRIVETTSMPVLGGGQRQAIFTLTDRSDQAEQLLRQKGLREEARDAAKVKSQFLANMSHEIRTAVPEGIIADPGRLRQVIVNLVGNSVNFTSEGELRIAVQLEEAADSSSVPELLFSVSDSGIGIPADQQDHIFEAFTQADISTTRKFGGTGLGLAICSKLVAMMDGRLWLESQEGVGSTFFFMMAYESDRSIQPERMDSLRGRRALIAEPSESSARALAGILESQDVEVIRAGAAETTTVALCSESNELDVVFLASSLVADPALLSRFHEDPKIRRIPLIVVHPIGRRDGLPNVRGAGWLSKPLNHERVIQELATVLGLAAPARKGERSNPERRVGASLRILVAEDNSVKQKLIQALLTKRGHKVTLAVNGVEAVQFAEELDFDAILMDLQMPEMDGLEATARIRRAEAAGGSGIRIIAMTAHAMVGDRERCIDAGMDDYLMKPISIDELDRVLSDVVKILESR